ncbi:hypothetical protein [Nocardia anaemiae]|uniref:hypothetical protein n=1 Tax=Nocardia anaemiae TaxID=263910 RepID=UPI0007A5420E|nr:hypothetical protein [Nocardia anaemiae]
MFAGLARVIGRLDHAVGNVAKATSSHLAGTGHRIRGTVSRLEHADAEGARHIGRLDSETGARRFVSTDGSGRFHRFNAEDVVSVPLKDRNGKVIGVSFPSRRGDVGSKERWARADFRSSDFVHYAFWRKNPGSKKPEWTFGRRRQAPWADDVSRKNPVYVHAHADSRTFYIKVKTGRWTTKTVQVDGRTYGELLADNQHLERAFVGNPDSSIVLLSCSPARPGGSAAANLAEHLHTQGGLPNTDIYAAKGDVMTQTSLSRGEKSSLVGVEVDPAVGDSADSLWEVYRAPGASRAPGSADGGT